MLMNLSGLRYFLALAEIGSFTRAAERLNVTQPTLSMAIARLEAQLGVRLFERDRRRASLTPAGQRFVGRAQTMMSEWRQAQRDFAAAVPSRRLRLGLIPSLPRGIASEMARRLVGLYGPADLEITEGGVAGLAGRLRQGKLDIAVILSDDATGDLPNHALLREPYRLAIAATHVLATRERCSAADLADLAFLVRQRCEVADAARRIFAEHGVRPRLLLRSPCEETVADMVVAGLGAAFLPESLARPGMALLAVDELPLSRRLVLAWRPDLPPEAVDAAREAAQGLRWRAGGRDRSLGFAH